MLLVKHPHTVILEVIRNAIIEIYDGLVLLQVEL